MRSNTIFALAACLFNLASALDAPIPGYSVVDLSWTLTAPNGSILSVSGTVQDVVTQLTQLDPSFDVLAAASPISARPISVRRRTAADLAARQNLDLKCGIFERADGYRIDQGIQYLRGLQGRAPPHLGPGPGQCSRVSCSYNAAIWWCNDNASDKYLDGWLSIVNSVQHTRNHCSVRWGDYPNYFDEVSGQNFEVGAWNTIVRRDRC